MEKKNLFFDFDGMKFDTLPAQVTYVNERYGIHTVSSEYIGNNDNLDVLVKMHAPHVSLSWEEIYQDIGKNFHASIEWHTEVKPMEHMCEVVALLAKKYTLYTVTARQKQGMNVIQYLLDKHIPNCISDIHCVWDYTEGIGHVGVPKKDFMQNVPGNNIAFFDDTPKEIKKTKDFIPSYLFDPMGLYKKIDGVTHIQSWTQIGDMFL